jgi:FtsH-binding integral membrane protein
VANIASYSDPVTVLIAAAMTLGVTVSVTAYACLTKTDFTTSRGILCGLVIGMLLFGIFTGVYYESRLLGMVFCLIFIIIYTIFIVIDTQMIAGGKRGQFSYDDYIVASLILYIDIIRLFLYMLRFLKK